MSGTDIHDHGTPWWKTRSGFVLCGFLLVAAFYLIVEHTAHVFGVLPFLLILACPLMHLFHHHGGHGHGGHQAGGGGNAPPPAAGGRGQGDAP